MNIWLGGTTHSNALSAAVRAFVDRGLVMVIAARNDGVDMGDVSPADVVAAIIIGAMFIHGDVPSFSKFG